MAQEFLDVSDITPRIVYTATASQTLFVLPFVFFENSEIRVYQNGVLLTLDTDYTVIGAEDEDGGTVTLVTGATAGDSIIIARNTERSLTTHIPPSGPLDIAAVNFQFSRLVGMLQEDQNTQIRTLHLPESDSTPSGELASQALRANKLLGFDSTGAIIYPLGPEFVGSTSTGVAVVDSRATAQVTAFDISVNVVKTEGLVLPGDGGGAEYVRGIVSSPGAFLDGSGTQYWGLASVPGAVVEVDSRASAAAASFAANVNIVVTNGYTTYGDGGGARYKRGIISSPGAFQDAHGVYWGLDLAAGVVNPLWFGAKGDQTTNDYTALQAAATAAVAIGGELFLPLMFKTLTAISITGRVSVRGTGFHSSPINYGFGATTFGFDTRSSGFKGSGIICGVANSAFNVATTDSVIFENFHVTYPTAGNNGVAAFDLNSAAGDTGCNINSIVRGILINNANVGIDVTDWLQFEFDNIYFVANTNPIIAGNTRSIDFTGITTSASAGDSKIVNCTFFITQGSAAIQLLSGAGYRIANNKFNGANAGIPDAIAIEISPQDLGVAFSMVPGIIADNSIEGFGVGVFFTPNASSQGQAALWTIVGNEFFCTVGINMASGIAIPQWVGGLVIAGNAFTYGQNGSTSGCIAIAGVNGCVVADNTFGGDNPLTEPAIFLGSHISNLKIGNNVYSGTAQPPGVLTPSLPSSGVGVTNNSGYTVIVNVYGGTVGSVVVNIANSAGSPTVSQVTNCAVTLNPGDQIVLTYSGGPAWTWRALNP